MDLASVVKDILDAYPTLNYQGFGYGKPEEQASLRVEFFDHLDAIEHVIKLLEKIEKAKRFNRQAHSKVLKHWASLFTPKYISNGSFIVGAIICGFKMDVCGTNGCINISRAYYRIYEINGLTRIPKH